LQRLKTNIKLMKARLNLQVIQDIERQFFQRRKGPDVIVISGHASESPPSPLDEPGSAPINPIRRITIACALATGSIVVCIFCLASALKLVWLIFKSGWNIV
jgi:hypothetical protein